MRTPNLLFSVARGPCRHVAPWPAPTAWVLTKHGRLGSQSVDCSGRVAQLWQREAAREIALQRKKEEISAASVTSGRLQSRLHDVSMVSQSHAAGHTLGRGVPVACSACLLVALPAAAFCDEHGCPFSCAHQDEGLQRCAFGSLCRPLGQARAVPNPPHTGRLFGCEHRSSRSTVEC